MIVIYYTHEFPSNDILFMVREIKRRARTKSYSQTTTEKVFAQKSTAVDEKNVKLLLMLLGMGVICLDIKSIHEQQVDEGMWWA